MSMLLMVKAMQTKVGNPLRKLVLIKLADNANDSGECWPSYQHIADQCEISKRSVITHVGKLEEMGLLRKVNRAGSIKKNSSNLYILSLDGESPAPPSESPAPPPSESPAPRTSHSFESVNEPPPNPQGGGEKKSGAKAGAQKIMELYNEVCGHAFTKSLVLNAKRQRQVANVCKIKLDNGKTPFADYNVQAWKAYFELLLDNPWNHGNNDRGWKATFDYSTRPDVVIKTLENKYA